MPGIVSTDPLEACDFSNVRSISSDGGFKSCSFWQSSLVCEYNINIYIHMYILLGPLRPFQITSESWAYGPISQ